MKTNTTRKNARRLRRKLSLRRHVSGTAAKPRLAVHRTLNHIYVQLIDDAAGRTLAASSTLADGIRDRVKASGNCDAARIVGEDIAAKALGLGVSAAVFDRAGFCFHGRVKALAEGARAKGLKV